MSEPAGENRSLRVAALQMSSVDSPSDNLRVADGLLDEASSAGCVMAALPENFAYVGARDLDKLAVAEACGTGPLQEFLADAARRYGMWIVGGSLPLVAPLPSRCYGACLVFDPEGQTRAVYRKMHLFDVDLPARGESYRESASMAPGDLPVTVDTPIGCLGVTICYDVRFPELYRHLAGEGATVFTVAAAFTRATGAAHWHTLLRARAIENLAYVIAPAQYGSHPNGRETFGHSIIIDPWGGVLAERAAGDGLVIAEIDPTLPARIRNEFPALQHRRL